MLVLGLSIGQLSTAALLENGRIVAASHEERCLREAGVRGGDLDAVVIAGNSLAFGPWAIGFDSSDAAKRDLPATLHPADKTLRAQILEFGDNPAYHDLICAFKRHTGVGALLNTSFNLHGEPIVCSPEDALHVLDESDIDMILLEDVSIKKGKRQAKRMPELN